MMAEPTFVASVGYFPERYGNFLVPMALAELSGIDLPPTVLVPCHGRQGQHLQLLPRLQMRRRPRHGAEFPQEKFVAHLAEIRKSPEIKGVVDLIPTE